MVKINRIAGKIKEAELTQKQVAEKMQVSEATLSNKMQGKVKFTVDDAESLSKILSLTSNDVIDIFFSQ